ncbi:MAG: lipopolysaccharide biosynthesis protein [Dyella sp.]|uniref:lipopolysaccharide biosynthesis protein n=1 Tax=Dyella sp. TaxID=1869338 RepID=UPI003F7F1A0D
MFDFLNRLLPSSLKIGILGRNSIYGTVGLTVRAIIQAGYLLLMSRWLGVTGYGTFAGSVALAVLAAPLASWGMPLLLAKWVARNRLSAGGMWATALIQVVVVGSLLSGLTLLVSMMFHQAIGMWSMLLLGVSELLLLPIAQVATGQCFAFERGLASLAAMCVVPSFRLVAALAAVLLGFEGLVTAAVLMHFAGSILGCAASVWLVGTVVGWPSWRKRLPLWVSAREGAGYAVGGLVATSYLEVDKVLMLQLLGGAIVGPYTVAFRVISLFGMPVSALISATLPRLMASHRTPGQAKTFRLVLTSALLYGCAAGLVILVIAPIIPMVFGVGFRESVRYSLLFAPWPILFALHQAYAARITACDRQRARVLIEGVVMILMIVSNVALLRRLGPDASILVLLAAEVMMTFGCLLVGRKAVRAL